MQTERYQEADTKSIATKLLSLITPDQDRATVVGVTGDLGAGKTTLAKALAEALGVTEMIQSPTFVVAKFYQTHSEQFSHFVHIDAYRIESVDELRPIGFEKILIQPNTLVYIEWPERIESALPKEIQRFLISHDGDHRVISRA